MKLLKRIGFYLTPLVLLLSACVPVPEGNGKSSLYNQPETKDIVCINKINGSCNIGVASHMPIIHTDAPVVSLEIKKSAFQVGKCLNNQLQKKFNLPSDFLQITSYADGGHTIAMVNPFTKIKGLQFDIINQGLEKSRVNLYANNMELSKAWLNLPNSCR